MDEGSIANREQAEKCRDLAKEFMKAGDFAKAARFFDKSLKLYQLPGVTALKEKAEQLAARGSEAPSSGSARRSTHTHTSNDSGTPRDGAVSPSPSVSAKTERPFTPEQESASKKILLLAKKSHYEVLGVARDAEHDVIKKSYRKLALRFHPDKNSAPSAEGAFKAISAAFDTLSDAAKREMYDQYGHDADTNGHAAAQAAHGFRGFPGQGQGMHDLNPEELFSFLFANAAGVPFQRRGGGQGGQGFRTHTFHFGGGGGGGGQGAARQGQGAQQGQGGGFQFMPSIQVLLVLLFVFSSLFSGSQNAPLYGFRQTSSHPRAMSTSASGVSKDIKYFVSDATHRQLAAAGNSFSAASSLRKMEKEVEADYRQYLGERCREEKSFKNSRKYQARFQGAEAKKRADAIELPSCEEFQTRFVEKFNS